MDGLKAHSPELKKAVLCISADDVYDGVIRLLCDAQRFGFVLEALAVERGDDGEPNIIATFVVPVTTDSDVLVARLSRHPSIKGVAIQ